MRSLFFAVAFVITVPAAQCQPAAMEKLPQLLAGRAFGSFSAVIPGGKTIDNKTLSGKVSLILLWYPSLGYSHRKYTADYLQMDTLAALQKQYSDFQIISLLPDTTALALFQIQNPGVDLFRAGKLASFAAAHKLCDPYGMPSCILVDKAGVIARTAPLGHRLSQEAMADKIKDLMMPPSGTNH